MRFTSYRCALSTGSPAATYRPTRTFMNSPHSALPITVSRLLFVVVVQGFSLASEFLMTPQRARELVQRFTGAPITIVGDVMLDQFVIGRVNRISPEAPVPVVEFDRQEFRVGGAANVASNVNALGGRAELVGLVGKDAEAEQVSALLKADGIGHAGLVPDDRPTTRKLRIVTTRNQQVARVDYEHDGEPSPAIEAVLAERVRESLTSARVVIVSDYLKGAITRALMTCLVSDATARAIPVLVDPKIPHITYYRGATVVTPNHHEAEAATLTRIKSNQDASHAGRLFRDRTGCGAVLITRGEQGMSLVEQSGDVHLPAAAREVSDVTGAGDTVIATLALGLAAGATLAEAAELANHAAGIVVGKFGPATVTQEELLRAFGISQM